MLNWGEGFFVRKLYRKFDASLQLGRDQQCSQPNHDDDDDHHDGDDADLNDDGEATIYPGGHAGVCLQDDRSAPNDDHLFWTNKW